MNLSLVHPCDMEDNAGCVQVCNKKGDGFVCSCKSGLKLEEDKSACMKSELNKASSCGACGEEGIFLCPWTWG